MDGLQKLPDEIRHYIKKLETKNQQLEMKNRKLEKENKQLKLLIKELQSRLKKLEERTQELPSFVKSDKRKRRKKLGQKSGHKGYSRPLPDHVDEEVDLSFDRCPDCGALLSDTQDTFSHYVEDIKMPRAYVKKYNIHRKYCKVCKKMVSPQPVDVLSRCRFGLCLMLFVCFQKYGLHIPFNKIAFELETYFGIKVSEGELCLIVQKIAELFGSQFEALKQEMRKLKVKYVDETGWRINGQNHWLWAFISEKEAIALYKIDRSRGSKVPVKVLGKKHDGITVSDFYSAYNRFGGEQQKSWVHLLRETSKLADKKNTSEEMKQFHKRLKRLYHDSVKLKEKEPPPDEVEQGMKRFFRRLDEISTKSYSDENCQRLAKRLRKHRDSMFRFLTVEELRPDNNIAEQGIRPNVVIRKISGGNRSKNGAKAHEVMMTIVETYKRRDQNFFEEGMTYIQSQLQMAK